MRRSYFRHSEDSDDMILVGMDERGKSTMAKASVKIAKAMKKEFGTAISPKAVLCRYHNIVKQLGKPEYVQGYTEYTGDFNNLRERMADHMMDPNVDLNITIRGKEIHVVFK